MKLTLDSTLEKNSTEVFHAGERALQQRAGTRERMAAIGKQVIRNYMPEQHRDFFQQLPFLIFSGCDASGQPWASIVTGAAGFITSVDSTHLNVSAQLSTRDPLQDAFSPGAMIGLLGIEPHTRRRNRMNGIIETNNSNGFSIIVNQSFGNCPKYIQARKPFFVKENSQREVIINSDKLDAAATKIISNADTFFIASVHASKNEGDPESARGVDVSHRGGKSGFVRVIDNTLYVPDYAGNSFFNTLGNLLLERRAGLLFIDFDNGDLLYVSATAEIIWDKAVIDEFEGAQRVMKLTVTQQIRMSGALPLRWSAPEFSPFL
ncbi:MAG: putative pyridoxamine 5-phosphate oxidase, FMN-binding protein [Verrucomicrobiaceae bacterium]|nr:putative pyridoxamine 5-phosphate oxidase, FMN-binding protein [Verrucomicrobiaceae bacterium]